MPASAIALASSSISAPVPSLSPSSFWIALQLLAQDVLALAALDRLAGLLADVARDPQHLDPMREQLDHLVEPGA